MFPTPGVYDVLTTDCVMSAEHCTTPLNIAIALLKLIDAEFTVHEAVALMVALRQVMSSIPAGALTETPPDAVISTVVPVGVESKTEPGTSFSSSFVPPVVDSVILAGLSSITSFWPPLVSSFTVRRVLHHEVVAALCFQLDALLAGAVIEIEDVPARRS